MKKIFFLFLFQITLGALLFAQQTVASDFYLMKNQQEADLVVKAINSELHLSEPVIAQLQNLLSASAKRQQDQFRFLADDV